jgi:hypothetical protein
VFLQSIIFGSQVTQGGSAATNRIVMNRVFCAVRELTAMLVENNQLFRNLRSTPRSFSAAVGRAIGMAREVDPKLDLHDAFLYGVPVITSYEWTTLMVALAKVELSPNAAARIAVTPKVTHDFYCFGEQLITTRANFPEVTNVSPFREAWEAAKTAQTSTRIERIYQIAIQQYGCLSDRPDPAAKEELLRIFRQARSEGDLNPGHHVYVMLQMLKVPLTREETEELQTNWTEFIAQQQQRLRVP